MPTDLRSHLNDLASAFTTSILEAIRSASLADLIGHAAAGGRNEARPPATTTRAKALRATLAFKPQPKNGSIVTLDQSARIGRRSAEDVAKTLGLVVAALKAGPMRAEELQRFLKIDKRELPRVLKHGLATKKLRSKGQKRATTYAAA